MKAIIPLIILCGFSFRANAQVSFALSSSPVVGTRPYWVTAADINGDGKLDLISANNGANTLSVLTNDGAGSFLLASTLSVGSYPESVTAADLNGDGKMDLICANSGGNTLSVLTNNGVGGFALASLPVVGSAPYSAFAADVNGDGKLDLVCANYGAGSGDTLSVLTNNGSGGFLPATTPVVGTGPVSVVAADVNGDGRLDLICANIWSSTLSILTNNGNGGFALAASPVVGTHPYWVTAADVNGDDKPDLISANRDNNTLTVLTNDGSGGFVVSSILSAGGTPQSVTAVDVNGDGALDLVSVSGNNTILVLTNAGNVNFVLASALSVGNSASMVTSADLNGNGKMDLISANSGDNTLSVLTNTTTFPPPSPPAIITQPIGQTNLAGTTATFSIKATAVGEPQQFSYQWRLDGTNLPAATNSSLVLTNLTLNQAGNYDVVVADSVGSVTSSPAILDVRFILVKVNGQIATGTVLSLSPATVTISGGYPGGYLFYTLDGSTPTTSSTFYSGLITLTNSAVVRISSLSADFSQAFEGDPVAVLMVPAYSLQTSIVGSGTLSTNPPTGPYLSNSVVILTATPALHWAFDHWAGDATGNQNPLNLTMNGPRDVQAVFVAIPTFNLQTSISGNGTLNTNPPSGPFDSNSVVILTATPALHWAFDHWAGDATGSQNPLNLTMNGPRNVQAVFVQTAYPLTLTTPGGGNVKANGLVIVPTTYYPTGSVLSISATPSNGWSFLGWQGSASGTNNPLSLMMNKTNTIQAIFGTVAATNSIGGRVLLCQPNPIPYGTILTVSAVPDPGNYFVMWSGSVIGTNAPTRITVTNANPNISALFAVLPAGKYTLAVIVNGNGFVTNNPQRNYYNPGDIVSLKATNNSGASFFGWTQDAAGTNNPLTISMTTNKMIQANFGLVPSVSISPLNLAILAGSNAVLTASALGLPPLAYQWQNSQGIIPGATNAIFIFSNTQPTNADGYFVVVTNASGSVTSLVAMVTVIGTPTITNQPPALTTVTSGHTTNFAVAAYGWPALTYQWQLNGANLNGATSPILTLQNAFPADAGTYTVVITNVYGSITSNPALLNVLPLDIVTPTRLANGQFQFTFDTATGVQYAVEYSTNLMDWHPLLTVGGNDTPLTLTDPNTAGSPQRYYRIVQTPP